MPEQHPLFDTFRSAEELANLVDQRLTRAAPGDAGASGGMREAMAFTMLHLVESFPRRGSGHPRQSLDQARVHLLRLQGLLRHLLQAGGDEELARIQHMTERVITRLAFAMSWIGDSAAAPASPRYHGRVSDPLG